MDIRPYEELKIAPRAMFDRLPTHRSRVRFMLPTPDGDWRALTWGHFAQQIKRAGLGLKALGLASGDRGAIFAPNRVEWLSAALGLQAIGGVMVPVYPASTAEQAAYVVQHSDAKVLFVDTLPLLQRSIRAWSSLSHVQHVVTLDDGLHPLEALAALKKEGATHLPSAADLEKKVISWGRLQTLGAARDQDDPGELDRLMKAVSLDQPGLMLYTSGTSGPPKGVPLTHKNIGVNGLDWLRCNHPLIDEGAVDLLWLPMSHIFGFGEACLGNTLGFTSYMTDPLSVMGKLPETSPSVFMSVPVIWEKLAVAAQSVPGEAAQKAKLEAITGGKLKFCLSGGAGLKREVKEFFHRCGLLIIEGYGLTETSPTLTLNRPDAFRFDTVGKVLPSVQVKLAEDGEILAKGDSVFGGYHKDPEATKNAFTPDGWFLTGDVGKFTDDGFLQIVDRKKDILVTAGGKNVAPANIEVRFNDDPLIAHAVVYGDSKRFLVAGLWLNPGAAPADATPEQLKAMLQRSVDKVNEQLASYESIKKFVIMPRPLTVQDGLLTATLKVRRKKVYEAFHADFEALYA
jgi:long-chain acyl-CoA synthetase